MFYGRTFIDNLLLNLTVVTTMKIDIYFLDWTSKVKFILYTYNIHKMMKFCASFTVHQKISSLHCSYFMIFDEKSNDM